MKFTKVQGTGNDFILVETSDMRRNWSRLAVAICDRHFGIGADGLLVVSKSDVADFRMRLFNADGSEGRTCGNGLRCVARYVVEKGLTSNPRETSIETLAGVSRLRLYRNGGRITRVKVGMGKPKFGADDIPVIIGNAKWNPTGPILNYPVKVEHNELLLNFASIGTPHAVHFLSRSLSDFPLSQVGPKVERLNIFPDRVNFEVAHVRPSNQIEVRVWERGAGETLACGSGACAVAVVARLHGYVNSNKVDIKLPGGTLGVAWDGVGEVFLSGPAETVFIGEWPEV